MEIPLVDLKAQYDSIRHDIDEAIRRVLEQGRFILGPEVRALEGEIASYIGVRYAVGVGSGTDALRLALLACGVKPGDEIITTPFTFIATTEAIAQCSATPVFVDVEPGTFNIDPEKIEEKVTERTKAILPVHLYGQPADMDPILDLALANGLKVIEDCAQSLGAEYKGRKTGSLGDAGCLSFFPSKILGAYGDGGMVVTNNPEVAEKVEMLRRHGCKQKYYHLEPGFNSRLDELQAAILRVKMGYLDEWIDKRQRHANLYLRVLDNVAGIHPPFVMSDCTHIFNYYTIRADNSYVGRDGLGEHLASESVSTTVYYPLSLHLQHVHRDLGYGWGDFPNSERAQEEVLSLPMYPEVRKEQIERVADAIARFCKRQPEG